MASAAIEERRNFESFLFENGGNQAKVDCTDSGEWKKMVRKKGKKTSVAYSNLQEERKYT